MSNILNPGNFANPLVQSWTPTLTGQTDNPVATYTTQIGRFTIIGGLIFFRFQLVTSTMTKTTLTDNLQVTLPFAATTLTNDIQRHAATVFNATPISVAASLQIASGSSVATFQTYEALASNPRTITWAATAPGVGVLTNVITVIGSGFYEYA